MKASHLLSLLAAALVANAQSGSDSASAPVSPSLPLSSPPVSPSVPLTSPSTTPATSPSSTPPTSPVSTPPSVTSSPPTSAPPSLSVSNSVTTDANGQATTVQVTETFTPTPTSNSSASSSATNAPSTAPSGGGLSTGGIIGLAVAGGTALICIAAFFIWKFTRKRMADFDDNENIKWPELNDHSSTGGDTHALPVTNTGRAGFGGDLSRTPSVANTYNASSVDLNGEDPYAVPPLPHMNPAQPYRDDPGNAAAYYDPYRGPVPQTFNEAVHGAPPPEWGQTEAIPMTQMGRGASPAPPMMYDGRASPGPQAAYGRASPGPQAAYGRSSPGPQAAYTGRASPGPQAAYAGRASPGPQGAYAGQ